MNLKFIDATLRDGSHAIKHQFSRNMVSDYCHQIDKSGVYAVIVGHGNGLGASTLQVGLSKETDDVLLRSAIKELKHTKLGVYMIPGFGTIEDDLEPAIKIGASLFKIGCQCTEADTTKQHIEYLSKQDKEVYGVLMMYHMTTTSRLVEEAKKMQDYGAKGVILMDSAGASTPELVKKTISTLRNKLNIEIGFHAHNNLGLAVSNSYIAIQEGCSIIDGTIKGYGAGAGNCPLETLVALLKKENYNLKDLDWYKLLDVADSVVSKYPGASTTESVSIVSGVAGVFSAFKTHVLRAAEYFNVDPRDIFFELGRRKAMAGQEDMIIDIASELQRKKNIDNSVSF